MRDVTDEAVYKFLLSHNPEGVPRALGLPDPDEYMKHVNKNGIKAILRCKRLEGGRVKMEAAQLVSSVRGTGAYRVFLDFCETYNDSIIVWEPDDVLRKYLTFRGYEPMQGFHVGEKCEGMRWTNPANA